MKIITKNENSDLLFKEKNIRPNQQCYILNGVTIVNS